MTARARDRAMLRDLIEIRHDETFSFPWRLFPAGAPDTDLYMHCIDGYMSSTYTGARWCRRRYARGLYRWATQRARLLTERGAR